MDQSLKIEHLSKHFAETTVLSDLNVEIPQGSFTCVLGPSGSGKTTLLMLLAGIEKVSKGRIFFGDEDITDIALEKRKAGIVFLVPGVKRWKVDGGVLRGTVEVGRPQEER